MSNDKLPATTVELQAEVVRLRGLLAESEGKLIAVFDHVPYPIAIMEVPDVHSFRAVGVNRATMRMFGLAEDAGTDTPPTFTPDTRSAIQARLNECLAAGKTVTFEERLGLRDREVWTHAMYTPVPQGAGRPPWVVITSFDITEQKMREQEELNIREAIIQQQSMTLAELSTPLLTISNRVVVLPLVGTVDSRRAQQIMETLLEGIATRAALVAILDITGVAIVDTQVANALLQAAKAARLLGTQVILTGIRPEVAQTLVGLGVDLSGIVTRSTLQAGIAESLHY